MLVDADLLAVDVHRDGLHPGGLAGRRLLAVLETADHQDVGDDGGAGGAAVRRSGQPHRRHQFAEAGQPAARLDGVRAGAVHGVPGGDQRDQAAGADQGRGLADEVGVDRVPAARVVPGIAQVDAAERHVPDRRVERAFRQLVSAKLSQRICACGYSAAATCAVIGSSSMPTIAVPSGASPMKLPAPQPGSRTRPPPKPNAASPSHIAWAIAGRCSER